MKGLKFSVRGAQMKVKLSQVNTALLLQNCDLVCLFFFVRALLLINTSSMQNCLPLFPPTRFSPLFCIDVASPLFTLASFVRLSRGL